MSTKTYRYQSEYAQQLRAEGEARGEARSVLKVLRQRGVHVPDPVRERITGCTDVNLLDEWLIRSLKVTSVEELFD